MTLGNSGGLISLFFSGLSNEEVVIGLLEVEFGNSESVHGVLEFSSKFGDQEVGVIKGRVRFLVNIVSNGEISLSLIIDLSGQVKGVSGSIHNKVGLSFLVKSLGKDFLGIFVGAESKVVNILSIESSGKGSLGILSSLAGLGFSVDEDVVGFLEFLSCNVENFLSVFKIFFGNSDNFSLVVDVGDGKSDNLVSSFEDFMSFCFSSISSSSLSGSSVNFSLSSILLRSGKVEGKSGLGVELLGSLSFFFFVVDDLDGSIDSAGCLELLSFNLSNVILNWDISVGNIDQVRG